MVGSRYDSSSSREYFFCSGIFESVKIINDWLNKFFEILNHEKVIDTRKIGSILKEEDLQLKTISSN